MSKASEAQKQGIQQHFAKKSSNSNALMTDADAVARRRRIEELKEQKRFEREFDF